MLRNTFARSVGLAVVAVMATISVVAATPGSGVLSAPVLARGTLDAGVKVDTADVKLKTRDDIDVATQTITIAPGGHTGWHSHPGPVIVTISSGTMSFYSADDPTCSPTTYQPGDTFVDQGGSHVHIARNEGGTNLVLFATYLLPVGAGLRTDAPDPGTCAF